ncbi:TauD/TfdA family dioxygenase [Desulfobacterota bacterium AH_259_B03_O07]|nr:TauD/TfdA family dioxygenase [Desulfobacterota bacterium AH_259_B03_O07]
MASVETLSYRSLPLIVEPTTHQGSNDFNTLFKKYRKHLKQQLQHHGALLFRGFRLQLISDFEQFVDAFFTGSQSLSYTGGFSKRDRVTEGVYTSTEFPSYIPIQCHNEMAYFKEIPRYICFFCHTAPKKGGETPIADCRRVLRSLDPELRSRFEKKGISYKRHLTSGSITIYSFRQRFRQTWQDAFETDDRETVESHCRAQGLSIRWDRFGGLLLINTLPATRKHPETGEKVWCNQAHIFKLVPENVGWILSVTARIIDLLVGKGSRAHDSFFGDGTPLSRSDIRAILQAFRDNTVIFPWQKGDVMVLDNYLVAHGRMPFKGPRKIFVAMR